MSTLRITVEWLQGAYHGREWPPSPYRLYQAMRARLPRGVSEACALEAALRHLETLPAPDIIAPAVDAPVPVSAIVVNNDGDRALAHAAIRVHPLPNAGVRYADGRIRRVLLTAAHGIDAEAWGEVVWRLEAAALIGERDRAPLGRLAPLRGPDPVLDRFCAEARRWTTATPVVLAGYDHRRGRARPARAVRRLLRHAGIDERLLESVTMASVPDTSGSAHARCFPRPGHLARWPCRHMTLTWTTGVVGPLALGAGAGVGLGLFVPAHR